MSNPPQFPLLGKSATFDTRLADPAGTISDCWLSESLTPFSLSTVARPSSKESRKRYRAGVEKDKDAASDAALAPLDSADDMVITDNEGTGDAATHAVKRRLTAANVADVLVAAQTPASMSGASLDGRPFSATAPERDAVHPCTPTVVESSVSSPVSDVDERNTHQLVLLSPSASPIQSAVDKPAGQGALEKQLQTVPCNQKELVSMILNLSNFVSLPNKNNLIFSLLQQVGRQSLSSFCDLIQTSLNHDLLTSLPLEIALDILSYLDPKSILSISVVCRSWFRLVSNTDLWCYLLRRDNLLVSEENLQRELANPAKLMAEWAPASFFLPKMNHAQILYKKRFLILQRWMDPKYQPKRISVAGHGSNIVTCLQHDEEKVITGIEEKVITGIERKQINVHFTKDGELSRLLMGHDGGVWALKYFSNTLVSGSTDRDVRVWNIRTGRCTHVFRGHTSTVRCLDILHPVQIGVDDNGEPVIFPEEPLLVTGSRDHNLHVWKLPLDNETEAGDDISETKTFDSKEPNNPYLVTKLVGHTQSVRSVAGYGNIVVSGSYDTTVRVWDLRNGGKCKHVFEGHTDKIYSTALNFKTRRCFSGSMDSSIKIWDLEKGKLLHSLEGHNLLVGLLELSDKYLVSGAVDTTLRVWNPNTGENLWKLKGHNSAITCFKHDALRIVSGSERMLKLWDIKKGKFVRDLLTDITGSIWQVSFDSDRCVAALQTTKNGTEETFIEILDFSEPLYQADETDTRISPA